MAVAIKVENLSKIYRLGEIGTGTISRDLERWVKTKVLGQEDPFLRIGESNDRSTKGTTDIVYSLRDINFEIEQGDAVGIIGRNGAGKSTLLKILSRVTAPTAGRISLKGRVASLLEVGTGFHPELTGRENIYLNGAMLGMRRQEISRKLEEIVDFSGVERYIDTPVKRYSSGMYVRLAFAVAAHLESEILIVDEVLAVGDAEFQNKCLGKMGEVSKGEGRTVLFVSHNMGAIESFCKRIVQLDNGKLVNDSCEILEAIGQYLSKAMERGKTRWVNTFNEFRNNYFDAYEIYVELTNTNEIPETVVNRSDKLQLCIKGAVKEPHPLLQIGFGLYNASGHLLFWSFHTDNNLVGNVLNLNKGEVNLSTSLPIGLLNEGKYRIDLGLAIAGQYWICELGASSASISFEIMGGFTSSSYWSAKRPGDLTPNLNWHLN